MPGPHGLALFPTGGEVRRSDPLAAPPRTEIGAWAPLPHVLPLAGQVGAEVLVGVGGEAGRRGEPYGAPCRRRR